MLIEGAQARGLLAGWIMSAMADCQGRQALLGRLVALGWFTQNGEVAATQAVGMLLEEAALREALLGVRQLTGHGPSGVASLQAESVHDDLARPDLEGHDRRGRPLVVIEAKFGARLTGAQIRAYMNYQLAGPVPAAIAWP